MYYLLPTLPMGGTSSPYITSIGLVYNTKRFGTNHPSSFSTPSFTYLLSHLHQFKCPYILSPPFSTSQRPALACLAYQSVSSSSQEATISRVNKSIIIWKNIVYTTLWYTCCEAGCEKGREIGKALSYFEFVHPTV